MSDTLQNLIDRAVFFSTEVQQHFGRLVAGADFDIDFSASPHLRFTGERDLDLRPHMIGSDVGRPREANWHWGWANDSGFPEPVIALSRRVHEYGQEHGVAEFTETEVPVDSEALPTRLVIAAKLITGAWAHYPADAGGGTTVWVLVDDPAIAPGEPQLKPVVRAIASGITDNDVADHRTALESYFRLRGLRSAALPADGIRLLCADGSADITFDEEGRIATCQAHQPLEGEAAEQFADTRPPIPEAGFGAVEVADAEAAGPPTAAGPGPGERTEPPSAAPENRTGEETAAEEEQLGPAAALEESEAGQEKKGFFKRLFGR